MGSPRVGLGGSRRALRWAVALTGASPSTGWKRGTVADPTTTLNYDEDERPVDPGVAWDLPDCTLHVGYHEQDLRLTVRPDAGQEWSAPVAAEQVAAFARLIAALVAPNDPDPDVLAQA